MFHLPTVIWGGVWAGIMAGLVLAFGRRHRIAVSFVKFFTTTETYTLWSFFILPVGLVVAFTNAGFSPCLTVIAYVGIAVSIWHDVRRFRAKLEAEHPHLLTIILNNPRV